jgi:replicative DNA helicase
MAAASELFSADVLPALQLAGLATGLMDLDHLTHGLLPGALWVIAATPGAGRTTLACQVACHAATTGGSAAVFSGRRERAEVLTNLLASQAKVAAERIHRGVFSAAESQRLAVTTARLAGLNLRLYSPADDVWAYPDGEGVADFSSLMSSGRRVADLLVVDDLDLSLDDTWLHALPALQAWARTGAFTLVVTVPAEDVAAEEPCHPDLRRHADVVVRLRLPGQFDPDDPRTGQADLDVLRNRHGPQARVTVHFQGHYRRFTDA